MSPPLLPPTNHQRIATFLRQTWIQLSRTRPLASTSTQQRSTPAPPGIWGDCGRGLGHLVYRGLGVTTPLTFAYIIGIVTTGIAGTAVTSALLVASVTSLLTG